MSIVERICAINSSKCALSTILYYMQFLRKFRGVVGLKNKPLSEKKVAIFQTNTANFQQTSDRQPQISNPENYECSKFQFFYFKFHQNMGGVSAPTFAFLDETFPKSRFFNNFPTAQNLREGAFVPFVPRPAMHDATA